MMVLKRGSRIGRYEIKAPVGAGGMGQVFRATDTRLQRDVAVKVLPDALARDRERLARFEREAHLLASLNHPNIASIHGLEDFDGTSCLVLELVEGETLAKRIATGALPVEETVEIARQIASAMEAAHEKGIVHRDLKPANVMVTPDGTIKVLDFGLAKALQASSGQPSDITEAPTATVEATREGLIVGTAPYMSPEQASSKPVDKRADIWSFGCLLYECLTGRPAFRGETTVETLAQILQTEPDWSRLPATTPASIRRLLRRCLEKDPRRRIHDIADARIELEEGLEPGVDPTRDPVRRWRRIALGAGLAGLAVGVLGAVLVGFPETVTVHEPQRPAGRFVIRTPGDAALLPLPDSSSLAVSPDGERIAYVSAGRAEVGRGLIGDHRSRSAIIFVRRVNDYEASPIDSGWAPFFSPDGQWIGYLDHAERKLKKQSLRGGAPITLCEAEALFRGASWGDDDRIYFSGFTSGISVVSAAGGEPEPLTSPDREAGEKTHRYPHVLPGARGLLFTIGSSGIASYSDASIALLSLVSGETRILIEGGTNPRYAPTGHIVYARGGALLAVPFDLEAMEIKGPPFRVLDGVVTSNGFGAAHFSFSDRGLLAYVPGGPEHYYSKLCWLDRDGGIEPLAAVPPELYNEARFSPDGRWLVVDTLGANANIWAYDVEHGVMTRLTRRWDNYTPIWTRDGARVTFTSNRGGGGGIWQIRSDGSGEPERLFETGDDSLPLSWSPGDRTLFYQAGSASTGSGIWSWSAGEEPRAFLDSPSHEFDLQFSPDGRWMAYQSDESGQPEVYVAPATLTGRRWRVSVDGGGFLRWSPDGQELFYWRGSRLMVVPISVDDGVVPGRARTLLDTGFTEVRSFDVAPDGKRFVVVGRIDEEQDGGRLTSVGRRGNRAEATMEDFRVVVDWFDEIRREADRSGS